MTTRRKRSSFSLLKNNNYFFKISPNVQEYAKFLRNEM